MIYVVSGYMRTGTSNEMKCLEAGGMHCCKFSGRDLSVARFEDENYKINEGGLYELNQADYHISGFPLMYQNRCIKAMFGSIPNMAYNQEGYHISFMVRDPREIYASYEAGFVKGMQDAEGVLKICQKYGKVMRLALERIKNRSDILSLTVTSYANVLEDPLKHYTDLADAGWPIDPRKAASQVKSRLRRFMVGDFDGMRGDIPEVDLEELEACGPYSSMRPKVPQRLLISARNTLRRLRSRSASTT